MKLDLCIAGERFDVLFDGEKVVSPHFPDIPIEYTAPCGIRITQAMLVKILVAKLQEILKTQESISRSVSINGETHAIIK